MDFAKQLQVFAIHDGTIEALTLRNGDTVVKGDWYVHLIDMSTFE